MVFTLLNNAKGLEFSSLRYYFLTNREDNFEKWSTFVCIYKIFEYIIYGFVLVCDLLDEIDTDIATAYKLNKAN